MYALILRKTASKVVNNTRNKGPICIYKNSLLDKLMDDGSRYLRATKPTKIQEHLPKPFPKIDRR